MEFRGNGMCFGCGESNPIGLKLRFVSEGDLFYSKYTPKPEFQSYAGVVHGGIVSTLLDEVMANHLLSRGLIVVTAELSVRFIKPVPVNAELKVVSKVKESKGRLSQMEGWIEDGSGQVLVRGTAKMMHVGGKE
ncbi:PaaI family thioesterase [Zhaonella formicivorans]|uniref:PaaI family thioesterase n=1 Tax=Zhaonella formicivorans TaxID=2528593 RepID=UPI001D118E24|nr:PaaI family thioesterase [Zhaonella formicivorans]